MIEVKSFQVGPLMTNNYVVSDDMREACSIDCSCVKESEWEEMKSYIREKRLKPVHMLCTHLHFDHVMGCGFVYRDFGLEVEGSISDFEQYNQRDLYVEAFGLSSAGLLPAPKMNDISCLRYLTFGGHELAILHTPGHTPGGLSYYCRKENVVFVGDTLFQASIGRTDLPGGSSSQLVRSIRNELLTLPPSTHVFTGHGPATTIEYEQKFNPYI